MPLKGGKMDDDAFISCKHLAFTTQAMPGAAGDHTLDIYLSEDRHGSGSKIFDMQLSSPYVFKEFGIDANDEETIFLEQTTMDDGKTNGLKIGWGYDGVSLYAGKTKTFDGVGIRAGGEKVELVNSKILWPEKYRQQGICRWVCAKVYQNHADRVRLGFFRQDAKSDRHRCACGRNQAADYAHACDGKPERLCRGGDRLYLAGGKCADIQVPDRADSGYCGVCDRAGGGRMIFSCPAKEFPPPVKPWWGLFNFAYGSESGFGQIEIPIIGVQDAFTRNDLEFPSTRFPQHLIMKDGKTRRHCLC